MPEYKPNKDGIYRKSFVVGRLPNGQQKRETIRSKSLSEFKRLIKETQNRIDHGYDFDAKDMTVAEWSVKWLETYKRPRVRQHCYETYEINLRLHINPLIGHLKMTDVKPYHLQELLNEQKGKSTSNTQKIRFAIQQMFHRAYLDGVIIKDVSEDLTMPSTAAGERRPLTEAERKAVDLVATTHRAGAWVLTMRYAGLRPEETVPLMWSDIELAPGAETITVRRAAEWVSGRAQIKGLKGKDKKHGKEKERTIPIPAILADKLRELPHKSLYVFTPKQSAQMLTQTNVRRMWRSFQRDLDIAMGAKLYRNAIIVHALDQDVTPYYLRHTYATDLFEKGIDLKTAQYLLGHADIKTTANIYTHFTEKSLDKAAQIIRGQTRVKTEESK
jgi:integrase